MVAAVSVFFKKSTKSQRTSSESSQRNASSSAQQQMLEVTIAEIRLILQTVTKGNSKNSNNNITELFKVMFPDSQIVKICILGAEKI